MANANNYSMDLRGRRDLTPAQVDFDALVRVVKQYVAGNSSSVIKN
jgi:hypothetical protein